MLKFTLKAIAIFIAFFLSYLPTFALDVISASSLDAEVDEVVNFDENLLLNEFNEIAELTANISNSNASADEMEADILTNIYIENITLPDEKREGYIKSERPLGIPAFLWGCVPTAGCFINGYGFLGTLGGLGSFVLVYFITENDKYPTNRALYGCIAGQTAALVYYLIVLDPLNIHSFLNTLL